MNGTKQARNRRLLPLRSPSGLILAITTLHLAIGIVTLIRFLCLRNPDWIAWFFDYQSPVFFVGMDAAAFVLSFMAWKDFSPGQSLRVAWTLISLAAAFRLAGSVLTQVVAHHFWGHPLTPSLPQRTGWAIAGPCSMLVLAAALYIMLRLYKRLGLLPKLNNLDHALLGVVSAYCLYVAYSLIRIQASSHVPVTPDNVLHWSGDPLLCLLLFEAIFVHRTVAEMGWSLLARCWGAFAVAIFLTSLGSMAQWAVAFQYIPWPESAATWFLWYAVSAAFALGPAYQLEAIRKADTRVRQLERQAKVAV